MHITKEYLNNHPNHIFVYGDNIIHKGLGGAAKLRYVKNTYGFITKKYPNTNINSYFTVEEYKPIFNQELNKLIREIQNNPTKIYLVSRLGAGLANKFGIYEAIIKNGLEVLKQFNNVKFI